MPRVYLSSPHLGDDELALVQEAFESNWIAPLGPHVDAFERELAAAVGRTHAAALSSGTAALHLALRLLGVGPGHRVACATLTFCASASPILYQGAKPVFIDSERDTWNMDPALLDQALRDGKARGEPIRAVIGVDLYGQPAKWAEISDICRRHDVPLVEDAAEALGATYQDQPAGAFGRLAVFSFNGNKIITSSGGGMLVGDDEALIQKARFLATQARDPAPHYEHSELGYNYRLSNICAAIGRGQLRVLPQRVDARRAVFARYQEALGELPGIQFMPEAQGCRATRWLTVMLVDEARFGAGPDAIREALAAADIEARPVWKPMHLQPLYQDAERVGGQVAEDLFARGLCLPSGSNLSAEDQGRVIDIVRRCGQSGG